MFKFLLALFLSIASVTANAWQPTRPIQIIVANPPGGSSDTVARIVAEKMQSIAGSRVIVINKPGAQAMIGIRYVIGSANDGHILLFNAPSFVFGPLLGLPNSDYNPTIALSHVGVIGTTPAKLYARSGITGNVRDIIDQARREPALTWAVTYTGAEFAALLLSRSLGNPINLIRYNGSTQAYIDLIAGNIDFMFDSGSSPVIAEAVKSGKVRMIAVLTNKTTELPTLDSVLPGVTSLGWYGLSLAANTPQDITRWHTDLLNRVLQDHDTRLRLGELYVDTATRTDSDHLTGLIKNAITQNRDIAQTIRSAR